MPGPNARWCALMHSLHWFLPEYSLSLFHQTQFLSRFLKWHFAKKKNPKVYPTCHEGSWFPGVLLVLHLHESPKGNIQWNRKAITAIVLPLLWAVFFLVYRLRLGVYSSFLWPLPQSINIFLYLQESTMRNTKKNNLWHEYLVFTWIHIHPLHIECQEFFEESYWNTLLPFSSYVLRSIPTVC